MEATDWISGPGSLRDELVLIDAPVLASLPLQGRLDPEWTRASTLKRYLSYYREWRLWL